MCKDYYPRWGTYHFLTGWQIPDPKSLRELASLGGNDLEHVINRLLRDGSEEAELMAEELFDRYS